MSSCTAIAGDWYQVDRPHSKAGNKDCPRPVRKPCRMDAEKLSADWCQMTFTTPGGERLIVSVPWSSFSELQAEADEAIEAGAKDVKVAEPGEKRKKK